MTNALNNVPRELKPCPFCGGTPELPNGDGTQYEIECGGCGQAKAGVQICDLMTLEERAADTFTDYRYGEEFVERAKVEAIERWNTRAPSPAAIDADHVEDMRAMVAAPSPAGVDGLEMVGYFFQHEETGNVMSVDAQQVDWGFEANNPRLHRVCALTDYDKAQAIIDGLRGENERIRLNIAEYNEAISCYQSERDQQAQRIGELEGLLRSCLPALSDGGCAALANRIAATLSAGKEGE